MKYLSQGREATVALEHALRQPELTSPFQEPGMKGILPGPPRLPDFESVGHPINASNLRMCSLPEPQDTEPTEDGQVRGNSFSNEHEQQI